MENEAKDPKLKALMEKADKDPAAAQRVLMELFYKAATGKWYSGSDL